MPALIPGPNYWTATKVRWERIGHIYYGYPAAAYDGEVDGRLAHHAEQSLRREGYVRKGQLTRKGVKLAQEWEAKELIVDRTVVVASSASQQKQYATE